MPSSVAVTPTLSLSAALADPVPTTAVKPTAVANPVSPCAWGFLLMSDRRETASFCRPNALVRRCGDNEPSPRARPTANRSSARTEATSPRRPKRRLAAVSASLILRTARRRVGVAGHGRPAQPTCQLLPSRRLIRKQNNNVCALGRQRMSTALAVCHGVVRPRDRLSAGQADAHPRPSRRPFDLSSQRAAGHRHDCDVPHLVDRASASRSILGSRIPFSLVPTTSRRFFWSPTSATDGSTAIRRAAAAFVSAPMISGSERRSARSAVSLAHTLVTNASYRIVNRYLNQLFDASFDDSWTRGGRPTPPEATADVNRLSRPQIAAHFG